VFNLVQYKLQLDQSGRATHYRSYN